MDRFVPLRLICQLTTSVTLLALAGCNSPSVSAAAQPAQSTAKTVAGALDEPAKSASKPGYAIGAIRAENGKPISVPDLKYILAVHGIGTKSGERLEYTVKVKPDGTYEQRLVDGTYQFFAAKIEVKFEGKTFLLDLVPIGDDQSERDSEKGIVQDYVWKIRGARPGRDADETKFTAWYGASVNMKLDGYRNDIKKSVKAPPKGTKWVFTLTPKSKLIDGSEGKELTFTREFDPLLGGVKNGNLPDVPIGVYVVKGEEIAPNGTKKPVLILTKYPEYGESLEIRFEPGSSIGAWPKNVNFTRPAD